MSRTFPLVCLALFIGGCRQPEGYEPTPLPPPQKAETKSLSNLFPLKEGTVWTYVIENTVAAPGRPSQTLTSELLFSVNKVKDIPGGKRATIEVYRDDELKDSQNWRVTDKGVYQETVGLKGEAYTPPQMIIPLPVKIGEKYTYKGKGVAPVGLMARIESRSQVLAPQVVETSMGDEGTASRVEAVGINTDAAFEVAGKGIGIAKTATFFQPDVGIVRMVQTLTYNGLRQKTTMTLKKMQVLETRR